MKENVKFWALLAAVMLAVSVAVMLIDLGIKAAILEESNTLRRMILNGREAEAASSRTSDDDIDRYFLLDNDATRLETPNVSANGHGKATVRPTRKPRPKPRTQGNPEEIPPGN